MHKRLGCLTPVGIIAALLTLLIIAGAVLAQGGQIFSPGALNAAAGPALGGVDSHAATAGDCAACHAPPWDSAGMSARCLQCHTTVEVEIRAQTGLHGHLVDGAAQMDCRECHTEHRGSQAALTLVDADFPHELPGFHLTAHAAHADGAPFACRDCHEQGYSEMPTTLCADCHHNLDPSYMDAHTAIFGADCLACHDGLDTLTTIFDHQMTGFPLTGSHAPLDCAACHQGAASLIALQNTPSGCFDCHAQDDPHAGTLGTDCAACHTTAAWTPASFDHALTDFPLTGRHLQAECADCHADAIFINTPADCISCHMDDDAHAGAYGTDCAACHTAQGWLPAAFDHSLSNFPLTGAHVQVACTACHTGGAFRGTPVQCAACHAEPPSHAGLFGTDCAGCHTTTGWLPASYDGPHTFPMNHGDANTCRDCHTTTFAQWTCYTCHDPREVEEEHRDEDIFDFADCMRCHADGTEDGGRDD